MNLSSFAYYQILGMPIIYIIGLLALLGFIFTSYVGAMNMKGNNKIPLKWHMRVAKISIVLALIHVILAFAA